jgi:hypothetical protein
MSNPEVSQSCDILPHDHSSIGGDLRQVGARYEAVRNGLNLVIGFKKVEIFQCNICGKSIEVINPDTLPFFGGY